MTTTGPQLATAAANEGSGPAWSTPTRALTNNGQASVVLVKVPPGSQYTRYLVLSAFDFSAIPDGDTIDGIEILIELRSSPDAPP